jgi:hypothetical protein
LEELRRQDGVEAEICVDPNTNSRKLYAQPFPQSILTSATTTAQQSLSDDSNIGTDVKIVRAEAKSTESDARSQLAT